MSVYREPPPPCEACAAREAALREMLPFEPRSLVECPMCGADTIDGDITRWTLCTGGVLTLKRHWWKRHEVVHVCTISDPPHFHFQCKRCDHHWLMRTRVDSELQQLLIPGSGMEHS